MQRLGRLILVICAITALSLTACGSDPESSNNDSSGNNAAANNSSGNNSSGNNAAANNSSGNNASSDSSCSEACANLADICSDIGITQENCEANCSQMNQATLNCVHAASTCNEANACDGGSGNSSANNANSSSGAIGDTCSIDEECDSQYCRREGEAIEGQCAENDLGDQCSGPEDCTYERCMVRDSNDVTGFCSSTCTTDNECPFGWSCEESGNSAAKFCNNS